MEKTYYEVTIKEVTETEYDETRTVYTDETGADISYTKYDNLPGSSQSKCKIRQERTGKILIRNGSQEVYTQTVKGMDVLAVIKAVNGIHNK